MFTLKVENKNSQVLTLTQNESQYQVINIEGLNPPEAEIYTNAVANMDGEKFKSAKLQIRNVVLTIKVNGNAEENRLHLYEYFATGRWCKIYFENGTRNVFIEGYCETIECSLFTMNQQMQISIVCPDPYLKSLRTIYADISKVFANFEFPFDIDENGVEMSVVDIGREVVVLNNGEISTGAMITLSAGATVKNPVLYNVGANSFFRINGTLQEGDVIVIDTSKGHKSIFKISNGIKTNIINSVENGSTWFQLEVGINKFTYSAEENEELLKVEIEANLLYEGV